MTKAIATSTKPDAVGYTRDWYDFRVFAIASHGDQKYGEYPYSYHLATVECYLLEYGYDEYDYVASGWLHDTLEDTKTTIVNLTDSFNPKVAMMVWACTGTGDTRKERNEIIYENLKGIPEAAPVKVADRLANMKNCYRTKNVEKLEMYCKEWPEFKANVGPLMRGDKRACLLWNALDDFAEGLIEYGKSTK